jgi:hypothetical protein
MNGAAPTTSPAVPAPARRERDLRLDFFRGLTMFIIFVAHADVNPANLWIPARFGFSSGTELFVFCSGLASAIAFGSIFVKRGFRLGSARILYRLWQVYWAQIGVVLVVIGVMATAEVLFPGRGLNTDPLPDLLRDPATAIVGLLTLRWLPGYLDILPMYLVILALVPVMMATAWLHRLLPLALSLVLYALAWTEGINLTGNPWTGYGWFFNPFAWQLIFFTGFGLGMGWLKGPALGDRRWMMLAAAIVAVSVPLSFWGVHQLFPGVEKLYKAILPENEKTDLHWLRYVHFLALAYLVLSLVEPHRARLSHGLAFLVVRVGRQSLATFLTSLVAARIASLAFHLLGTGLLVSLLINLAGVAIVLATALTVGWFKSNPWAQAPVRPARIEPAAEPARGDVSASSQPVTQALLPAPRT